MVRGNNMNIDDIQRTNDTNQLNAILTAINECADNFNPNDDSRNVLIIFTAEGNRNNNAKNMRNICNLSLYLHILSYVLKSILFFEN